MNDDLLSFIDIDESPLRLLDRSTLEAYATCPQQARWLESGEVQSGSLIADVGNEVHKAFGETIGEYVDSQGVAEPGDLAATCEGFLRASRPDIQPDVLRAARSQIWPLAKFLAERHYSDILRWDGGEGEQSGQMAWDMPEAGARVTSEVDLLYASGYAREILHEDDFKSGHKPWDEQTVKDAFQFCLHACLVFRNYPDCEVLRVRVWATRLRRWTYRVDFRRKDLADYEVRVRAAVDLAMRWGDTKPEDTPAWPELTRCSVCNAAQRCNVVMPEAKTIAEAPGAVVDVIAMVEAKLAAMKKMASEYVKQTGQDIVSEAGNAFGIDKPKGKRRPPATLYTVATDSEDDSDG